MVQYAHRMRILLSTILVLLLVVTGGVNLAGAQGTGGSINSINKFARPGTANVGDTINVNVSINATPCVPPYSASVALVIDKSGSMSGTPLAQALDAASLFVDTLDFSRDEASVVAFSGDGKDSNSSNDATTLSGLSQNRSALISAIESIKVDNNTNIYEGLNQGGATLAKAKTDSAHALVLLTDGEANVGSDGLSSSSQGKADAIAKAKELKAQGIRIYTIGLGNVDASFLRSIATSAADYYNSPTPAELPTVYAQIARTLLADIGTDATFVETYDKANFKIVNGSQVPSNGVIDATAGTITWKFATLSSRQSISYQVTALASTGTYNISKQTDITYTQATTCAQQGQQIKANSSEGAAVALGEAAEVIVPAEIIVSLRAEPSRAVAPKEEIAYTFTATNRGKGIAKDTKLNLPFDPQLVELIGATFKQSGAWVSKVYSDSLDINTGTIISGDSVEGTIRFRVRDGVASGTQLTAKASFSWTDAASGGSGNSNKVTLTVSDQSTNQQYATLIVTPYSGAAGTDFVVKGGGFIPNEPVALWYNTPANQDVAVGMYNADANGEIEIKFSAPSSLAAGYYAMIAYGNYSQITAVGVFQIQ